MIDLKLNTPLDNDLRAVLAGEQSVPIELSQDKVRMPKLDIGQTANVFKLECNNVTIEQDALDGATVNGGSY